MASDTSDVGDLHSGTFSKHSSTVEQSNMFKHPTKATCSQYENGKLLLSPLAKSDYTGTTGAKKIQLDSAKNHGQSSTSANFKALSDFTKIASMLDTQVYAAAPSTTGLSVSVGGATNIGYPEEEKTSSFHKTEMVHEQSSGSQFMEHFSRNVLDENDHQATCTKLKENYKKALVKIEILNFELIKVKQQSGKDIAAVEAKKNAEIVTLKNEIEKCKQHIARLEKTKHEEIVQLKAKLEKEKEQDKSCATEIKVRLLDLDIETKQAEEKSLKCLQVELNVLEMKNALDHGSTI